MPNMNYVQGTYNGDSFAAMCVSGSNNAQYFIQDGIIYRFFPLKNIPGAPEFSWVERSYGFVQNQFWRPVYGFKISLQSLDNLSSVSANNAMAENAVIWAIDIANDESHGYDYDERTGPNDYDCSGFVNSAYAQAGFDVVPSWTTQSMRSGYSAIGFTVLGSEIANDVTQLKRGDILLHDKYHTAIYIGNNQMVAAHINELGDVRGGQKGDQTGREICVSAYSVYTYQKEGVYGWLCALRPPEPTVGYGEWHENQTFTSYEVGGVAGWTGTPIAADSMGVAVPWNHGSVPPNPEFPDLYYGQLLEIEVGNFHGVVLVNDCGNFGDHNDYNNDAVLDLQPGVWAAAGGGMTTYTGCRWRVVGHTPTDNTNGKGPWYVL